MDVSIAEAKNRLPELIRAVEHGEKVVITRHGKPVAQLAPPPPPEKRQIRWGGHPEWYISPHFDDPMTEEEFLSGEF